MELPQTRRTSHKLKFSGLIKKKVDTAITISKSSMQQYSVIQPVIVIGTKVFSFYFFFKNK